MDGFPGAGSAGTAPSMADGAPAIGAAPEVWAVIEKVAVGAVACDPAAREHVLGKLPAAPSPAPR